MQAMSIICLIVVVGEVNYRQIPSHTGAASPQCGGVTGGRGDTRGETELIIQTRSVVRDGTWTLLHTECH